MASPTLKVSRSIMPSRHIATSDGMAALEQRLATAKKQKPMKNASRPGATKGGFQSSFGSNGTGGAPKTPVGPIAPAAAASRNAKTPWNKTGKKTFGGM